MSEMLSQEEIDALLKGDSGVSSSSHFSEANMENSLSEEEIDALGEIGNISMGTSATTLFTLLNNRVTITTPVVSVLTLRDLANEYPAPCVAVEVKYTEGLEGVNLLILKEDDVRIITDLMMGGDGSNKDDQINDLHLSAIGEAMNQMIGSSSTSLSTMFNKKIDISPPNAFVTEFNDINLDDMHQKDYVAKISFRMIIGDIIDSEIMQIIPVHFAKDLVANLLHPKLDPAPEVKTQIRNESKLQAQEGSTQSHIKEPVQNSKPSKPSIEGRKDTDEHSSLSYAPKEPQRTVDVQPVHYQTFDNDYLANEKENIDIIMDVPLEITVELGRTKKLIKDILEFGTGTVLELDRLAGEPVDILVNGKFIAKGEVVVIDESFGVRITDIINTSKRLNKI